MTCRPLFVRLTLQTSSSPPRKSIVAAPSSPADEWVTYPSPPPNVVSSCPPDARQEHRERAGHDDEQGGTA